MDFLQTRMLCVKFCWNMPSGSGEEAVHFRYFVIIFPSESIRSLIYSKLNPFFQKRPLCRVWLKLAQCFLRSKVYIPSKYFYYYPLLEKNVALHLERLENHDNHSPKNALYQIRIKLSHGFWRIRFKHFFSVFRCYSPFSVFRCYSPLKKSGASSFK